MSTIISKSLQASDPEFDLDQVKGKVVITKKVIVPALQTVIERWLTKVTGHQKHVHVLVEPSPNCTGIFVPGNTSELIPDGSGVSVVLQNLSGRDVILEPQTEIGTITAANIVPSLQITSTQDLVKMRKYNVSLLKPICLKRANKKIQIQKISYRNLTNQALLTRIPRCNRKHGI